eukprot:7596066-Pyramimonas_sp.AAC.1
MTASGAPETVSEALKTAPRWTPGGGEPKFRVSRPKRLPGGPKKAPRGCHEAPRGPQEAPTTPQKAPRRLPSDHTTAP